MKAILCGANGAMGKLIDGILGDEVVGRVSIDGENGVPKTFAELGAVGGDMVIDFSHHTAIAAVLDYAKENGCAAVIGTTGHTDEEKAAIRAAAESIPVFFAANFSLGVALLIDTARQVAAAMPDAEIEIIEKHHHRKLLLQMQQPK
jgi:4-hydroxy-tetrahydrodipicolinate reductase